MNAGKLTHLQGAIISAYTGVLACPFADFHRYVEQILNRPVFTHELGSEQVAAEIKEAAKEDFIALIPKN